MIPIKHDELGNEINQEDADIAPFARGALNFDDFNYENINQYVLLEEPADKPQQLVKDASKRNLNNQERLL